MTMNAWLWAATALTLGLFPCGYVCANGDAMTRLTGFEAAGVVVTLYFLLLAEGFHRIPLYDIALTSAVLAFGGGMVFARFLERWL